MKKNKGFTLIELLAVIVILAVIALIAVPMILGVIDSAKKGAATSGVYGYINSLEHVLAKSMVDQENEIVVPENGVLESGIDDDELDKISVKGTKPQYIKVVFDEQKQVKQGQFCLDGINVDYEKNRAVASKNNYCAAILVKKVEIEGGNQDMTVSSPLQLRIKTDPSDIEVAPIWSSSNEEIAQVDESGLITAHKDGTVQIQVRIGISRSKIQVSVLDDSSLIAYLKVKNFQNDTTEELTINNQVYPAHVYQYDGDQVWNSNQTFGIEADVGSASSDAKHMIIVKVNGNLTIEPGVTVTTYSNAYGGPKGLFLYVTGTLENHGTISMSGKGAKAEGENVYLWKNENGSYEAIPANGASGGAAKTLNNVYVGENGNNGVNGTVRATGGGGAGGVAVQSGGGR